MKATVVVDNRGNGILSGEWGLCIYIEYGEKHILLDTGASDLFVQNAEKLGLDLTAVDAAVLSHAHYDHANGMEAARDEQRDIEARIEEIEKILKNAEVVVEEEVDLDKISIGCKIRILDCEFDEELEYKIVGSTEANSLKGKISNESPVGKALLGKKVGDTVTVETQVGELTYKVLEIQRAEEN